MTLLAPSVALVLVAVAVCWTYLKATERKTEHAPLKKLEERIDDVDGRLRQYELAKLVRR